jgi:hypothetical protein
LDSLHQLPSIRAMPGGLRAVRTPAASHPGRRRVSTRVVGGYRENRDREQRRVRAAR